jgi:sec-independent protein translocase protein TatB
MLDVGFSEILLTSAIALIVLGPERLPKVARQVGNWMGRARAMARQLTEQLEREVSAEELMKTQSKSGSAKRTPASFPSAAAPLDTNYTPTTAQAPHEAMAPHEALAPPHADAPAAESLEASAMPGADWHPAPPDSKPDNG